jgi:ATP-binding cassette, subfamily B, bacterial
MTAPAQQIPLTNFFKGIKMVPQAVALLREATPREFNLSIFVSIIQGFIPAGMGILAKFLFDELTKGAGFTNAIIGLICAQFALAVLGQLLRLYADVIRSAVRTKLQHHLRLKVAKHVATLDLEFFEMPGNYDAFTKAKNEISFRPFLMAYAIISIVESVVGVFGFFIAILLFQPVLVVVLILAALPTLIAAQQSGGEFYSSYDFMTQEGRKAAYAESLISNDTSAKEVRLFNLAPMLLKLLSDYGGSVLRDTLRLQVNKARRFAVAEVISSLAQYAAVGFVVFQVASNRATIGDFALLVGAVASVRGGITYTLQSFGELLENTLFFQDLTNFLALKSKITAPANPRPVPKNPQHSLKLEGVSFSYPGATKPVFEDLTLELRAGESTALVGVNGAGKTTLVKLLTRLYDPTEGSIKLDGIDIREFDPIEYRSLLGVILQDFTRYQLSAKENIVLGRADVEEDQAKLFEASKQAGAFDLISSLPDSWDTLLGRQFHIRGQDLSGGQWQKVALARALYRDAPILFLDEPTAALDAEAEVELFKKYKTLTHDKFSVLITHRFNTVKMASRILVIENGEILEDGSHLDLMRLNCRYAEMFKSQFESYAKNI